MTGIRLLDILKNSQKKLFNAMEISADYLKGFNYGYIIRKELPKTGKHLLAGIKGNSELIDGLKAGPKQYEKEIEIKINKFKQKNNKVKLKKDCGI